MVKISAVLWWRKMFYHFEDFFHPLTSTKTIFHIYFILLVSWFDIIFPVSYFCLHNIVTLNPDLNLEPNKFELLYYCRIDQNLKYIEKQINLLLLPFPSLTPHQIFYRILAYNQEHSVDYPGTLYIIIRNTL